MSNSEFYNRYGMVVSGHLDLFKFLKEVTDFAKDGKEFIKILMKEELDAKKYANLQILVLVAMKAPSKIYTEVLCNILDLRLSEVNNDDVVDLLDDIRDAESVPCLVKAAQTDWERDEFKHLNKKCIWILGKIKTNEARKGLNELLQSSSNEIKSWAMEELKNI